MHGLMLAAGLVLSAVITLAGGAHAATFVYVSNAEDGDIGVYTLASNGSLQPGARVEAGKPVMPMSVSPDKRFLYAAVRSKPFTDITYAIEPDGTGSKVTVEADVTLSGPAAQFGRTGLINEMSKRLIGDFVTCLEAKLQAGSTEEASDIEAREVRGISLFFSSLWAMIKRFFSREEK